MQAGLEHDARRSYTLNDIHTLQFIAANKAGLQQSLTTLRTFSSKVFTYGGSKYLETPRIVRENHIELWYVGGNNISNTDYIPDHKLTLPFYYSCDWDYDGLKIYERLQARFAEKMKSITLLPPSPILRKPTGSPEHNSRWKHAQPFSGLNESLYNPDMV